MFSLRSLLDKVTSVQTEISGKLSPKPHRRSAPITTNSNHNLTTGTELLNHYQNVWEHLHNASMSQASSAAEAAQLINNLHSWVHRQDVLLRQLEEGVAELPRLSETIGECTGLVRETGLNISTLLVELEKLEQICDDLHVDRMKSVHRHHLDTYREERNKELTKKKSSMEKAHNECQRARRMREHLVLEERHSTFSEIFKRDLEDYRARGSLSVREVQSAPLDTLESFVPEEDPELSSFLGSSERSSSVVSTQSERTSSAVSTQSGKNSSVVSAQSERSSSVVSTQSGRTSSVVSTQSERTSSVVSTQSGRTSSVVSTQSGRTSSVVSTQSTDKIDLKDVVIQEKDNKSGNGNTDGNANTDSNDNTDINPNTDSNANTDSNPNTDSNANTDTNANTDSDVEANVSNRQFDRDTGSSETMMQES